MNTSQIQMQGNGIHESINMFLSKKHFDTLRVLMQKYIEHKKISIPDQYWLSPACTELIQQVMHRVVLEIQSSSTEGRPFDITIWNRRVLSLCIPTILEVSTRPSTGQAQSQARSDMPISMNMNTNIGRGAGVGDMMDGGGGVMEDMTPEEATLDKDRIFMERLQELEVMRNIHLHHENVATGGSGSGYANKGNDDHRLSSSIPMSGREGGMGANGPLPAGAPLVRSIADVLMPQVQQPTIPTSISTVFMPTPPRRGMELLINSWQRNWIQYPQRNGFQWNGPLPQGIDLTMSRIVGMLLPRKFIKISPYLVLHLEGAGNNTCQCILVPDTASHLEWPWRMYRPVHTDLGYLKTISCPWMIKLYTANGTLVPLGKDGDMGRILSENRMEVSKSIADEAIVGDELWMFGPSGSIFVCEFVSVLTDTNATLSTGMGSSSNMTYIHIQYKTNEIIGTNTHTQGHIFNFSQQWSVIFDVHRSLSTATRS